MPKRIYHVFYRWLSIFKYLKLTSTRVYPEKALAPHSNTVAWKIPWMEEPGRLQSMGSKTQTRLSDFTFTFHFHALEKEMATHSSVLAWSILGTGEPGGLPSMGSHRVGHDWSDLAAAAAWIFRKCSYFPQFDSHLSLRTQLSFFLSFSVSLASLNKDLTL